MELNIKICGVKTPDIAAEIVRNGASHIGFIFFERSPRNVTPVQAAEIANSVKGKIKTVAVVVDASDEFLTKITSAFKPDYIQLHGSETPQRVTEIKNKFNIPIIKAIGLSKSADLEQAKVYVPLVEYIMFDAKPPVNSKLPGGNAISFDWDILHGFNPDYNWILSGGLDPENINKALKITNASFIDISSGVESSPGVKDISKIQRFISNSKKYA